MKRILVVDETKAVRETIAIILGSEFSVTQKSYFDEDSGDLSKDNFDLLILGAPSQSEVDLSSPIDLPSGFCTSVLFLVDSESMANKLETEGNLSCLVKPFHPFELKEKIKSIFTRDEYYSNLIRGNFPKTNDWSRYLEFPYLSKESSILAKRYIIGSVPVLISGEMGSGHERVARAFHSLNPRGAYWIAIYPQDLAGDSFNLKLPNLWKDKDRLTIFLSHVEKFDQKAQASLMRVIHEIEDQSRNFWILSSSCVDLIERVHQGEFLETLYYRLAPLILRLPSLRERSKDLPVLTAQVAHDLGAKFRIGDIAFTPGAIDRICNYLWPGNILEFESFITRTMAMHRQSTIQSSDIDFGICGKINSLHSLIDENQEVILNRKIMEPILLSEIAEAHEFPDSIAGRNGHYPEDVMLINQLAHELKNPMVTIKTFAQLLDERFDDSLFRTRFREAMLFDINRINEILETLLDFSRFESPILDQVVIERQLLRVLDDINSTHIRKGAGVSWGRRGKEMALVDGAQFRYAFNNILGSVFSEVMPGDKIKIDVGESSEVIVSYFREGNATNFLANYLGISPYLESKNVLPIRILLAKRLIERNGGSVEVKTSVDEKVQIKIVLQEP